jgi:hypothetical protein
MTREGLVEEELCMSWPEALKTGARYLKPDVCLWRNMPSILKLAFSRTQEEARGRG